MVRKSIALKRNKNVNQLFKQNLTDNKSIRFLINDDGTFSRNVSILEFVPDQNEITTTKNFFSNEEASDFLFNEKYVEFNGVMKIKTQFTPVVNFERILKRDNLYSTQINKSDYDNFIRLTSNGSNFLFWDYTNILTWNGSSFDIVSGYTKNTVDDNQFKFDGVKDISAVDFSQLPAEFELLTQYSNIPTQSVIAIPPNQLIIAEGNIDLTDVLNIYYFNLVVNEQGNGIIKTIFSFDGGDTWNYYDDTYSYDGTNFKVIESMNGVVDPISVTQTEIDEIQAIANDEYSFDRIPSKAWNEAISTNHTIKMGYVLSVLNENDIAETDSLDIKYDIIWRWKSMTPGIDYNYNFYNQNNKTVMEIDVINAPVSKKAKINY